MLLSQFRKDDGGVQVVARDGAEAFELKSDCPCASWRCRRSSAACR